MRGIYVLITVILLLNLMIAIFQYSINRVQQQADRNWNIYRKAVIFQYNNSAILPAPLSLIMDVASLLNGFCKKSTLLERYTRIIPSSKRLKCSTLQITAERDGNTNPFMKWMIDIRDWEQMLLLRHNSVGAIDFVVRPDGDSEDSGQNAPAVSPDALLLVELRQVWQRLKLETEKLSNKLRGPKASKTASYQDINS